MNGFFKAIIVTMITFQSFLLFSNTSPILAVTFPQKPEPSYAKWGRLAMKETNAKYPNAQIIDYLHIGKTSTKTTETEKFKLWLRENQTEFGVYVNITFDPVTQRVVQVILVKTDR